jgi:hypothetical protein
MECPTRSLTLPVLIGALKRSLRTTRHPSRAALLSAPAMPALPVRAAHSTGHVTLRLTVLKEFFTGAGCH